MNLMEGTERMPLSHTASSMSSCRTRTRAIPSIETSTITDYDQSYHHPNPNKPVHGVGVCGCSCDDDDDNSSVAMEAFLRSKMGAVFSSDDNDGGQDDEEIKSSSPVPTTDTGSQHHHVCETPSRPPFVVATTPANASSGKTSIYNPFSSYSPYRNQNGSRNILGVSAIPWGICASSPTGSPRVDVEELHHNDEDATVLDDDDAYDFDEEDSVFELERWAHKIRVELRHAEMLQLAREAERAAEAGEESFAAKLSTYGKDDSSLINHPHSKVNKPNLKRHRTVSEGVKIPRTRFPSMRRSNTAILQHPFVPYYRDTATAGIGVMELRDANEVFPSFSQFHNHLRTHFARSNVDEQTLFFRESSSKEEKKQEHVRTPSDFFARLGGGIRRGSSGNKSNNMMSISWSDRGSRSRSPSDFFNHARFASDLFHQSAPSDFFHSLSFDRWVGGGIGGSFNNGNNFDVSEAPSEDTVDMAAVLDVLADHHHSQGKPPPRLPKIVVPPGLELPALDQLQVPVPTSTPQEQCKLNYQPSTRRFTPAQAPPPPIPSPRPFKVVRSEGAVERYSNRNRPLARRSFKPSHVARALFDDEEPESDADSIVAGMGEPLGFLEQHRLPSNVRPDRSSPLHPLVAAPSTPRGQQDNDSLRALKATPTETTISSSMHSDSAAPPMLPLPPPLPEPPPAPSDFMTPARLRVIRKSMTYNHGIRNRSEDLDPEHLLVVTPNSMIDSSDRTSSSRCRDFSRSHAFEISTSSILLPENLGFSESSSFRRTSGGHSDNYNEGGDDGLCQITSNNPLINVNFKPRLSVSSHHAETEPSNFDTSACSLAWPTSQGGTDDLVSSPSPPQAQEVVDELEPLRAQTPDFSELPATSTVDEDGDCYEIGRMLTPTCDHDNVTDESPSAHHAKTKNIVQECGGDLRRRNVTVKIFGSSADPDDHSSVRSTSILHHSQTISIIDIPSVIPQTPAHIPAECSCLALSPPCSQSSACSTPAKNEAISRIAISHPAVKPSLMRRSSSANALSSLESSPRGVKWNLFNGAGVGKPFHNFSGDGGTGMHSNKPFHTAMSLFSSISPKKKSPFLPPKENDDFLHNYLYCSKTPENAGGSQASESMRESGTVGVGAQTMCAHVNFEFCFCASLFSDTSIGTFLDNNRRSTPSGPILSLSGNNNSRGYYRMEPEKWFDLDQFEFLEHLAGRARKKSSPWNVNFQAPTLRKGESCRKLRADSIVDEDEEGEPVAIEDDLRAIEEKKSEENNNSRSPKHARHLSLFPSRQGPQFALSDTQFEMIYGVAPEELADSLTRDLEIYHNRNNNNDKDRNHQSDQVMLGVGKDSVKVDVAAFLAGANKVEKPVKDEEELNPLEDTLTF